MLLEFIGNALGVDAGGHEVMVHVAQHADDFGRQRFIQDFNGFIHIAFITFGYGAIFHLMNGALSYLLYISNKMRHKFLVWAGLAVTDIRLSRARPGCPGSSGDEVRDRRKHQSRLGYFFSMCGMAFPNCEGAALFDTSLRIAARITVPRR